MEKDRTNSARPDAPFVSPTLEAGLRRYFRKRVPPHDVDDLVQEVILRIQGRQSDTEIEDVERYIFVVAANLLKGRAQHKARLTVSIPDNWDIPSTITPERLLLSRERLNRARDVIGALPDRTRQVFLLHRFEEMTYRSIAVELGISVSAVEKHIIAALKAVKSALEVEP